MASIKAIRGMHDILPSQTPLWQFFEAQVKLIFDQYGYQEIRMPIAEKTDLFCRSIGEATDVVEKEMYTFADRNGDPMTLRPEGTASCVRAAQEHGLTYNQVQRLWYHGPMSLRTPTKRPSATVSSVWCRSVWYRWPRC